MWERRESFVRLKVHSPCTERMIEEWAKAKLGLIVNSCPFLNRCVQMVLVYYLI